MTDAMPVTAEALLAHADWVRGMARRLVRDPDLADDLVQDTWLEAVENPPRTGENPRGWLATVLRRRASRRARADRSRLAREAASRPREPDRPDELLGRLEAHQHLVAAVRAMHEPYRSVVLLRFLEGLKPREIARRRNAPVATIHSQLHRGLALLRDAMDRRCGRRRTWAALVTVLPRGGGIVPLPWILAMQTKKLVVAGCSALILISAWALWPPPAGGIDAAVPDGGAVAAALSEQHAPSPPAVERIERTAPVAPVGVAAEAERFGGRVLDAEGRPLTGMPVAAIGGPVAGQVPPPAVSDAAGRFELPVPVRPVAIVVRKPGWTTVLEGVADAAILAAGIEPVVVAAPSLALAGTVVGDDGSIVAGAQVQLGLPPDLLSRMQRVMDRSISGIFRCETDAQGRFAFGAVPALRGAEVQVRAGGYLPGAVPQPDRDTDDLRIALARPEPTAGNLLGRVVDPFGAPAAAAYVTLDRAEARTGDDGRFVLSLARAGDHRKLVALQRGYRAARYELSDAEATGDAFVHLQLGEPTLSARGRVVDDRGQPVADAWVWVDDPEVVPRSRGVFSMEAFLGGGATEEELIARYVRDGRMIKSEDEILREAPTGLWGFVRSAADGSFELRGLSDRAYLLKAMDSRSYATGTVTVEAGMSGTTIVLGGEGRVEKLGVQLVAGDGTPLPGVRVTVQYKVVELFRDDGSSTSQTVDGGVETTGADGRVEFDDISLEQGQVYLVGDSILPAVRRFPADLGGDRDWVIELDRRMHLRIELSSSDSADRFGALDAAGNRVSLHAVSGEYHSRSMRMGFENGRTRTLAVSERARTLVFYKGGEEVERLPLDLLPGIVNEIRW